MDQTEEVRDAIVLLLKDGVPDDGPSFLDSVRWVVTDEEDGIPVRSTARGFTLALANGARFQISVVQSQEASRG